MMLVPFDTWFELRYKKMPNKFVVDAEGMGELKQVEQLKGPC